MKKQILFSLLAAFMIMMTANHCSRKVNDADSEYYRGQGKYIVDTTFKVLSGHLKSAIQDSGVVHAIQYCNLNAMPLVDSLSKQFDVEISRKTTRPRNRENVASPRDKVHIVGYAAQLRQGKELTPNLDKKSDHLTYYHPIIVQPQCLVCHGNKEMIGPAYEAISKLYPDDNAVNYSAGDLRGVWRIDFNN